MKKISPLLIIITLCFSVVFACLPSTTVYATTEATTTESKKQEVKTRKFNTNSNNRTNPMKANEVWDKCKGFVMEFQNEINLITNILIAAFVILGGIAFIINCIRLTTIESHPLAKKQEYMSLLVNLIGISLLGGVFFFGKFIIMLALGIK